MLVLGIETSCDETGVAIYDSELGLLCHTLHSQVAMHEVYGGVVPELASRDHIRRVLPLTAEALKRAGRTLGAIDAIAYTEGPGLAGALMVGAAIASGIGCALRIPVFGVHHLEGHLLSPLLSEPTPAFPFVALLVSGGHTQLMRVGGVGDYLLLGETLDDAAGEAFDKTAKLLGLGYPGGPAVSELAASGNAARFKLPRPMLNSGDLNFSFSGLKTAVLTLVKQSGNDRQTCADIAASFQEAIVDVLVEKSLAAIAMTGIEHLVVAGGVGANRQLREMLTQRAAKSALSVYYPALEFCTDNGAMIALAGAMRLLQQDSADVTAGKEKKRSALGSDVSARRYAFSVRPRWDLD